MPTNPTSPLFIGLMSGTSLDSIDAALVAIENHRIELVHAINHPLPQELRATLISLCSPGNNEIERMGVADRQLGRAFAEAVQSLLSQTAIDKRQVLAIGSHGQTIRHRPDLGSDSFTLQIGDPNTIAAMTGITTVADFRRRDVACNGQGAPLAPAFHKAVFSSPDVNRAVVNIGGIANVTLLADNKPTIGFDTGPGNVLMDTWSQQQRNQPYDKDGEWARTGNIIPTLLDQMLQHTYFSLPAPKSTGRELFNDQWLREQINNGEFAANDVQATLLEFTAQSISGAISTQGITVEEVYICGGGAYNKALMSRLQEVLTSRVVTTTAELGIPAEWVEGAAFAWLARQTLNGTGGNLPEVTGASSVAILGAIYPA